MRKQGENDMDVLQKIYKEKLIAIVRGAGGEKCLKIAEALYKGGFRLMEITFDLKNQESAGETAGIISRVAREYEGALEIGAGTVVSLSLAKLAADAGAKYIISPDTNKEVIRFAKENRLISIPGALTPTEAAAACEAGADLVKLFPAADLGVSYLKSLRAPLSHIPFLVVGGIDEKNLYDFLEVGAVGAGIGGSLVNRKWVDSGEYKKIAQMAGRLVEIKERWEKK